MPYRLSIRNFQQLPFTHPVTGAATSALQSSQPQWQYMKIEPGLQPRFSPMHLAFGTAQDRDDAIESELLQGMPESVLPTGMNVFVKLVLIDADEELLHARSLYFVGGPPAALATLGPQINHNALAILTGSDPQSTLTSNAEAKRLRQRHQGVWIPINALQANQMAIVGPAFLSRNFTAK